MRQFFTLLILSAIGILSGSTLAQAQCNLTNATSCTCPTGGTTCDLLPDITISWYALESYMTGPTEYSQTGNGANDGRLRLTGSTPNIGWGPLTVRSQDDNGDKLIVCGTDTFTVPASTNFTCPNGQIAKQILRQRIYQKDGSNMTYYDHLTPPLTYSNSSMYVDDWGIFTLRYEIVGEPDPKNWPIVGSGRKRGFCLMDYGPCTYYSGHCRDTNFIYQGGNVLLNGNFPNWGLGDSYNCSAVEQGISSGYTDIYNENLDGMWIDIPAGTCNGNYWIYYEVDPHNYFQEMDETNNWTLIPFTLALQDAPGNPVANITASGNTILCSNDSVVLNASPGFSTLWSNGATTQSIKVSAGTYTVTVSSHCGTATSTPFTVTALPSPSLPVTTDDTVCVGDAAVLQATGNNVTWYDQNNAVVGTGNTFNTQPLLATTTYYAQDVLSVGGATGNVGKPDSSGGGGNFTGTQYLTFNTLKSLVLKSVKVYSSVAGSRIIEVRNNAGQTLQSGSFSIPIGESTVNLNFPLPAANNLQITVVGTPNLWRSNGGVNYPYTMVDTLSITGSSAGNAFYYFFYNWEVEVGQSTCSSGLASANALVEVCSGVNMENLDKMISIYPNPAKNDFTIDVTPFQDDKNASVSIADLTGRTVHEQPLSLKATQRHTEKIDINRFPKGILLVTVTVNGKGYYRKLVVQ